MARKKPAVTAAALSPIQSIKLRDLRLLSGSCSLSAESVANVKQAVANLHQEVTVHSGKTPDNQSIALRISFVLTAVGRDGREVLRVQAEFGLAYSAELSEGATDEQVNLFGQRSGTHQVWPYWREFVQSMSTRMGLPAIRVPLLIPGNLQFVTELQDQRQETKRGRLKKKSQAP